MRRILSALILLLVALPALAQHNGTVVGTPAFGSSTPFGQAIYGLSDGNYITLPSGACPSTTTFTTEFRVNQSSAGGVQIMVMCGGSSGDFLYVGVNGSGHLITGDSSGGPYDSGLIVTTSGAAYNFIRVVRTATAITPYVNCTAGTAHSGSYNALPTTSARIGNFGILANGYSYGGAVDELQFTSVDKSVSGCSVPSAPYTGAEANTVSLFHLDGNANDSAGSAPAPSNTIIDPSNSAFLYSPFNWNVQTGSAKTINSGAYFRTIFNSTSAALTFDVSNATAPFSELWCRVDDQQWTQYAIASSVSLGSGLAGRKHLLECVVKSTSETITRWSATAPTMVSLTGLVLDSGSTVTAPQRKSKNILIFGDSITEGVRTNNNTATNDTDRNDVLGCYSYALTQLDAEVGIVGFGATGISVSGSGSVPALTTSYSLIYPGVSRSFSAPAPDVVVFNEGTNDGSSNIVSAYTGLLQAMHSASPTSKLIVLRPFGGNEAANAQAAASAAGATFVDTTGWFSTSDSSDGTHPYGYVSYGVLGPKLLPYITSALYPAQQGRSYTFF